MPKASRDSVMAKKQREKSVVERQEQLVLQRKVYADAILEGSSESEALRLAGYHPTSGNSAMRNEDVQMYLAEARQNLQDVSTLRRVDVMNLFLEAIEMARTLADPGQMINGADKLAKMMGYYAPESIKLDVATENDAAARKFKQLTDEELYEIASRKAKVIDGEVIRD